MNFGFSTAASAQRIRRDAGAPARGQSLVEFALLLPLLMLIIGGIVQFGMLFWAQNTLTQVARDTGRWAATQQTRPCDNGGAALVSQADRIAQSSSLIGYSTGLWNGGAAAYPASPRPNEGLEVAWAGPSGLLNTDCPPLDNSQAWFVTIRVSHVVPTFFPGTGFICANAPGGCSLTSTTQFRMEPAP